MDFTLGLILVLTILTMAVLGAVVYIIIAALLKLISWK